VFVITLHGTSYSTIQKEYFPDVTAKELQNKVQNSKTLRTAAKEAQKQLAQEIRDHFDRVLQEKQTILSDASPTPSSPGDVEFLEPINSEQAIVPLPVDSPRAKEVASTTTPNAVQFAGEVVETAEFYSVLCRTDLATVIKIDIDSTKNELVLQFISEPVLESEYKKTKASQLSPRPRGSRIVRTIRPNLPLDGIVALTKRYDYNTDVGRFLKLEVPRYKAQSFSLDPPQRQRLQPKETDVPLNFELDNTNNK